MADQKKRKRRKKRVEERYIVLSAPEGKKDAKGQLELQRAKRSLERDGFRVVHAGRLPSGRNYMLQGERPLSR